MTDPVKIWLHNNTVTVLDFPRYSPDLNPIENLWSDVAKRVESRTPHTVGTLGDVFVEEWERTDKDYLRKLVHSMPKRCQLVIEAKGNHIKY